MRHHIPSSCVPPCLWAVVTSLTLLTICANSSCPPDDPQCANQTKQSKPSWQNRLIVPLPGNDELGEPISEISEYTELTSQPLNESSLLLAGHSCHSHSECDTANNLSCEHFFHTTSTSPSSVPILTVSRLLHRRSIPPTGETVCSRVHCNSTCQNLTAEPIQCPPDSYIVERESDDQNCCIQTCKCLPDKCDKQQKHNCSYGFHITSRGDHLKPGNCCDQFNCVDEPSPVDLNKPRQHCHHGGTNYTHDQSWTTEDCNTCQCNNGVAVCDKANNCPLQPGCLLENTTLGPGQCCPPCKGCMYNYNYYPHSSNWMEDLDCQYCTCSDGRVKCHTTMCRPVTCSADQVRTKKDGECCFQCECTINCPLGFKKDSNDLDLCECIKDSNYASESTDILPINEDQTDCTDVNSKQCRTKSVFCSENDANCANSDEPQSTHQMDDSPGMGVGSWVACLVIIVLFVGLFLFFGIRHLCPSRGSHVASSTVQSKYEYHAVNHQEPVVASTLDSNKANSSPVGGQGQIANGHTVKQPQSDPSTKDSTTLNLKEETSQV